MDHVENDLISGSRFHLWHIGARLHPIDMDTRSNYTHSHNEPGHHDHFDHNRLSLREENACVCV